jgi:3',5'-cyclic AMP phosphodiesterase CpdA
MKKIAQISDLHIDDFLAKKEKIDTRKNFEETLRLAHSRGVSEVILSGDLGVPEAYEWIFETIRSYGFDFQVVFGNHDHRADFQKFDFLTVLMKEDGLYFSKRIEGLQSECIFLDSSAEEIGAIQLEWLMRQLAGSREPLVIFIHHPILDCGNTVVDRFYPLKNRDAVRQILSAAKREITIFCGHYHYRNFQEIREGSLRQFVTPSTAGQIKPYGEKIEPDNSYIGYREIWIADKKLQTEVVEVK